MSRVYFLKLINDLFIITHNIDRIEYLLAFFNKKRTRKQSYEHDENDIMALWNIIISIFYLKSHIEKSNTYDWKPKKVPKHLYFFHFLIYNFK